jgi:hypothetical protein
MQSLVDYCSRRLLCEPGGALTLDEPILILPDGGWLLFASPRVKDKQPYWPDNLMKRYIRQVARKAGINKNIGWQTFRHSFGTRLKANGKTQRPYRSS